MPCYSPLKGWKDKDTGGLVFRRENSSAPLEVACGQCLGCRLDYSRMWAMRIVHESSLYESNCFVTLTYDDEHVPSDWSLCRRDFVLFMKRLRKAFEPERIRFYMAGEYGVCCKHGLNLDSVGCPLCNVGRPHFHSCLFNCSFDDLAAYGSRNGDFRYTSDFLAGIWKNGFVDVGELNFESAAYVARYILKKVNGVNADEHYMSIDLDGVCIFLEPEYCTMSRRPGLGREWFERYWSDVFPSDEVPVPGVGVLRGVPRYYEEIFKCSDPLSLDEIKRVRLEFMRAHGDEFSPARLMDKYKVKKAQVNLLTRSL